ncbi:MAG: phosphoribosylaminoimidazolesuccinocarboxamide synthase [Nitrososphaerota archaeon]|nr:phosphoribosylaminoimidazolesuccinocarboxamide synthase [Nitrososphaerales archaeon]MDW8044668.1 phosphoribosylaminoimidazolesuccinocarboxamide synthase [Nitrososphaerota archaeon]
MEFKGRLIRKGKVKDIYEYSEDELLFFFTDRVSAFDVILPSMIPRKGEVLCKFAEYWFKTLGVKNHMVKVIGKNMMVVKKLNMIPIECIVRGYLYGSLYERVKEGLASVPIEPVLAAKLPQPIFDPTTKYEEKDVPITKDEILRRGWLNEDEYEEVVEKSMMIYSKIAEKADKAGFIVADLKLEFGKKDGEILLADSIGPDEFRLWPKDKYEVGRAQESYDKQPIRDWLIKIGYKAKLDEAVKNKKPLPEPPQLPESLIQETIGRYIIAYERITGLKFD